MTLELKHNTTEAGGVASPTHTKTLLAEAGFLFYLLKVGYDNARARAVLGTSDE